MEKVAPAIQAGIGTVVPSIFDGPLSDADAVALADVLKALADPVRLQLVSIIATSTTGEICACDLPGAVGRSQPTVSHHLSVLTTAGILTREQRGKWAWFRVRSEQLNGLRCCLADESSGC